MRYDFAPADGEAPPREPCRIYLSSEPDFISRARGGSDLGDPVLMTPFVSIVDRVIMMRFDGGAGSPEPQGVLRLAEKILGDDMLLDFKISTITITLSEARYRPIKGTSDES